MTLSKHGLGRRRSSLLAMVLCVLLAVAALACGTSVSPTLEPCSSTPDPDLLVPTPTPESNAYANILHHVSPSLQEQIYASDVIVRASFLSATPATERVPSADDGVASTCRAVQELRFKVHEYLKGSGADEVVVVVQGDDTYLTEAEARREAAHRRSPMSAQRCRNGGAQGSSPIGRLAKHQVGRSTGTPLSENQSYAV